MKAAGIIINHEALATDRIYTYGIPEKMNLRIGQKVRIPFGSGNRKLDGFVVALHDDENLAYDMTKMKEIFSADPEVYFEEKDLPLMDEIRKSYMATYLDVIKLMIPRGILQGMKHKMSENLYTIATLAPKHQKSPYMEIYTKVDQHPGKFIKADLVRQGFSLSSVNTLIRHGYMAVLSEKDYRYNVEEYENYEERTLNEEQRTAVETIDKKDGTYLLHGITGSGKTEVFMELIRRGLQRGEDAIVLLPEISLTPQMIERFKGRFGKEITIFHSRLSDGERYDEWHRVRAGKVKIAIGARSALFLPFKNLKMVIVDEEHETTYKSEMSPKYNAKEVARLMMEKNGGRLVLASATPSVESYYQAKEKKLSLVRLTRRATEGELPKMEVVDMREELLSGNRTIFSRALMKKMEEVLERKEQMILFLNRRGFSTFVSCRSCGYVFKCGNCDISMTYHKDNSLICHQCGARKYLPKTCPSCQSKYIKQFGTGTEKVEEAIRKMFPEAKVMRMDRDTTKHKAAYENMYQNFKNNDCDILIGTQMISKGLDFKDVTLVGILAADLSLNLPDFRSSEKTFQLITQVAGRAGRGDKKGEVVIQTYSPEHFAVEYAKTHDYEGFYEKEILMREALKNPPFTKIFHMVFTSEDEKLLREKVMEIGEHLRNYLKKYDTIILLGPSPCMISKIKNSYRWQIILKGDFSPDSQESIRLFVQNEMKSVYKAIKVSLDINPNSMM